MAVYAEQDFDIACGTALEGLGTPQLDHGQRKFAGGSLVDLFRRSYAVASTISLGLSIKLQQVDQFRDVDRFGCQPSANHIVGVGHDLDSGAFEIECSTPAARTPPARLPTE